MYYSTLSTLSDIGESLESKKDDFKDEIADYLIDDRQVLLGKQTWFDFVDDVSKLRFDVERLERDVSNLQSGN